MHKKIIGFILSFCMIFCFGGLAYAKNGTGQVEAHLHDLKGLCDNKAEVTIIVDDSTSYNAVLSGSTLTVFIGTTDNIFVTGQVLKYEVKLGSNKGETGKITIGEQEGNQDSEHDKGLNNYKCTYQKDSSGEVKPPCGSDDEDKDDDEKPPVNNPPTGDSEGDGIIITPPFSDGDVITPIIPPEEEITPPADEIVPSEEEEDVPSKVENTKNEKEDSDAYTPVKTGDMTGKTIWSIVFILSMLGLIGAFFYSYFRKRA